MGSKWGQRRQILWGQRKKAEPELLILPSLVRVKGLEPLRRTTPDPKSGASAIPPHSLIWQAIVYHISDFFSSLWQFSQILQNLLARDSKYDILRMAVAGLYALWSGWHRKSGTGRGPESSAVIRYATCIFVLKSENGGIMYAKRNGCQSAGRRP